VPAAVGADIGLVHGPCLQRVVGIGNRHMGRKQGAPLDLQIGRSLTVVRRLKENVLTAITGH
jgi:hypothetical protein